MTIGPEPMTRIFLIELSRGMNGNGQSPGKSPRGVAAGGRVGNGAFRKIRAHAGVSSVAGLGALWRSKFQDKELKLPLELPTATGHSLVSFHNLLTMPRITAVETAIPAAI